MTFHDLHAGPLPPLLPNAWDVPSALALIDCGFSAIGTTSFGVACSQGSPDGGRTTKAANLALAHALERLPCDLSLDVETLIAPADHAAKVRAIKRRSPDLFVNARVDTYWLNQDATVAATIERAEHYVAAGATASSYRARPEPDVITELTARLGVRRVSTGSLPYRAAIHAAVAAAVAVRDGLPCPTRRRTPSCRTV